MVDAPGLLWMSRPGAIAFAEWYSKQGTYARRLHNTLTTSATSAIQHNLFCGNHDAAVRAAIIYSLFSCCKAANVDTRAWLEDVLKRLPSENNLDNLLPVHWIQSERQ